MIPTWSTTWAQPGSNAALYFEHLAASDGLLGLVSPSTVTTSGASFDLCRGDVCTAYDQIVADPVTGRLVTFAIDGVPLSGRISGQGLDTDVDDVHARATTAYLSNAGKLLVVIELTNSAAVSVDVFSFAAVFQPTGAARGVEAIGTWGPTTIESNATQALLVAFPSSGPEGRLAFTGLRSDGIDVKFDVTVPPPA